MTATQTLNAPLNARGRLARKGAVGAILATLLVAAAARPPRPITSRGITRVRRMAVHLWSISSPSRSMWHRLPSR